MENNPTPMIPKEEIEKAAKEYSKRNYFDYNNSLNESIAHISFDKGVSFAESKLKEVMREAIEWALDNYKRDGGYISIDDYKPDYLRVRYTTDQLITKFLEEKNQPLKNNQQ